MLLTKSNKEDPVLKHIEQKIMSFVFIFYIIISPRPLHLADGTVPFTYLSVSVPWT